MFGERDIVVNKKKIKRYLKDLYSRLLGKVTRRLFLLLVVCGIMSLCCFRYLMQWQLWTYLQLHKMGIIAVPNGEEIIEELQEKAKNINFYEVEEKKLKKLLNLEKYNDKYTSMIFYNENSEFQFYGIEPEIWNSFSVNNFWYHEVGYYAGMDYMGEVKFKDTTETVMIYSMHQAMIVVPYFFCCLFLSILMFLPVLIYVWNRMRYVGKLKEEILVMADGDLEHPITIKGKDEIGILAQNLDEMRLAFDDNIRKEQEGKEANHELISSMSHDLRTPLTTLYGYLEILEQKKCSEEKREEYIGRCIEKVEEIRSLSNKMFEYAMVYEKNEKVDLSEIYLDELLEELEQNREFLELKGYQVQTEYQVVSSIKIMGNLGFFKRIFNNLFSNILKYGKKDTLVSIKITVDKGKVKMLFLNQIKEQQNSLESNKIGLKSVRKMVELQEGKFWETKRNSMFEVILLFPIYNN